MKEFVNNKKYNAILLTSKDLFWKYGFRRVTIDEICREAGTSKMTFYRFFPNKLEVARSVFDMVADEGLQKFKEILKEDSSPSEKMKKMLQLKFDGTANISSEFLNDFYNNPELGLSIYIGEKSKALWADTLQLFKEGQTDGWIRNNLNVEFMFLFMQNSMTLINDKEALKLFDSPQDIIMELANMFVYGISPAE